MRLAWALASVAALQQPLGRVSRGIRRATVDVAVASSESALVDSGLDAVAAVAQAYICVTLSPCIRTLRRSRSRRRLRPSKS